jgi:LysM repeat protein
VFKLTFLGLGQHMAVFNDETHALEPVPASILGAINQLTKAFKEEEKLSLVFNEATDWLIGADFEVLQAVRVGIVFYDPELYGLMISVTGSKAGEKLKIFNGLEFEILYKKINETIGMWQIDLTLPFYIRNLQFGAVSVTLPSMKVQIYTNGDFMIDLGFPANGDFTRSFSVQALPFVGSGGLYFGKLSSATSDKVPQVKNGSFSPVIAFGIGLRIGLGKDLDYGVVKAGMSVTVQGILEGIFAWYNAYPTQQLSSGSATDTQLVRAGSRQLARRASPTLTAAAKDPFYYMIQARVSLVGKIYGSVDLGIIQADLDVEVVVSLRLTLEAYKAIDVFFEVRISLSLRVRINLGLFKITIKLSFKMNMSFGFTIGQTDPNPPWGKLLSQKRVTRQLTALGDEECVFPDDIKWQPLLVTTPVRVPLQFVPQFTAGTDGPLGAGSPRKPYVVAMTYVSSKVQPIESPPPPPFDEIARGTLLWTLNAYLNRKKENTTLEELLTQDITIEQLNEIYCYLTQEGKLEPFTEEAVLKFLENFFKFEVTIPPPAPPPTTAVVVEDDEVSVFPIMPLLKLTTSTGVDVDFLIKTPASTAYLGQVKEYFRQMAVRYKSPAEKKDQASFKATPELENKSLASFIFLDFFAMLARSTVQDAISYLQTQKAPLNEGESLTDLVNRRTDLGIDVQELALANATRPLRAGVQLRVPGAVYTVKRGDTVQSIAAKVNHDILTLRSANPSLKGALPEPATQIALPDVMFTTSAHEAESLLDVSRIYGVSLTELARANADVPELFPAGEPLLAPYAQQENIGRLVEALQANQSFNNLSGLAARVLLQGLRPPSPADSPQAGNPAPLYELTGQQFDGSDLVADSTVSLTVPEAASRWFELGGGTSLTYTVTAAAADSLARLKTAPFGPPVTFETAKLLRIEPRRFTLPTAILWHTPVALVTANRGSERLPETVEPHLWQFPSELMDVITGQQALQPKVNLWTQLQEGPGQTHDPKLITDYSWSTVIEIDVRQTASGDGVFLPNTYEMTGMDSGGGKLLENLLVWYAEAQFPKIDKIQILYPPDPAVPDQQVPPNGLRSDADPTFFLLQTNLSTASNPPQLSEAMMLKLAAGSPQRDPLGQTDIEFLKLMWESAVVNSGGYVLYYEGKPKQGFPNYLFSQDGIGKLTLLITYTITDNVLRNFMNNVVVRQAIDTDHEVFYAQPVPQTVSDFTLASDQSLADVAARYRVTVSQLATQYNNAHAKLAPGKHLRIPPLTYRVRTGESLETIAARANITTQSIAEANDVSEGNFIRLPETIWRATAEDSLASLAERFSTTIVTLAHANKDVKGLIAESIKFDDRLEEPIATIPPGNIAFKFKRPAAVSNEFIVDPQNQLAELYNLLGYRIKPANGFEATNSALPISPETPEEGPDQGRWIYESVVPVFPFVIQPADPGQLLPSPKENPYNGVGNTVLVNFNWQDLFGNWLDSSLQDPSWPSNGFPIGYIDNLIPLDQWPAVTSDYVIAQGLASPEMIVTLRFNAALYLPSVGSDPAALAAMALTDLGKFRTIYYQLTQPDVRVTLSSTMQGDFALTNAASPLDVMVQFVLSIIDFLAPISLGQPAPPAPAERAMSQPVADENEKNLFPLIVHVAIARNLDLVNDEFKDVASVSTVTSRVPANAGQDKSAALTAAEPEPVPPLSLQEFAKRLETAFPSLKVLVAAPKKGLGEIAEEIWIVRFAPTETGIAFNIDGENPLFFAVEPLARNLLSRPLVFVYPYQTGKYIGNEIPVETSQNGVDLDQMGRDFLNAMEQVLGPQFSASTWKLEYGSGMPPPDTDPPDPQKYPYEAIVAAKESLAGAISKHVANVFADATPADALADAREMMRQQLLVSLTSAYTVDVVMQYPVTVTHSKYAPTDLFAPHLFGKPVSQNPDDPNEIGKKNAYSFSTGRFSLAKTTTRLTFSFETNREQQGRGGKQFDDVFKIDLFYQINAVEHEIHPVVGIDGYLASSWLTFVLPDSLDKPGARKILVPLGEQTIPVPLRAYPTPPSLSEQIFIPHVKQFVGDEAQVKNDEDKLLEARRWDCSCQYEYVGAAHDKILADIKLNVPVSGGLQAKFNDLTDPDLFAALVQFSDAYPGIARDLDRFLATGTEEQNARTAISSFAWLAQRVAKAWHTWQETQALYSAERFDSPEYHFVITQRAESVNGVNALVVTVQTTDALGARLPHLPEIQIEGYKTVPFAPTMDSAAYYFVNLQDEKVLPYDTGRNISTRRLVFKDFDILKVENAWAGAAVKRNEDLIEGEKTNPAFVFQSPVVRFVNVLTPLLDPDEKIDIADYAQEKPAKLAQFLSDFFIAFFEKAQTVGNENRTIRLGASYGYGLQDSGEETSGLMPDLEVTIPILLSMPTSISIVKLAPDSPFIKDVSDTIEFWFKNNGPSGVKASGKLWFDFSIYSSLSESQLPVLRMRRLYLDTNIIILPNP